MRAMHACHPGINGKHNTTLCLPDITAVLVVHLLLMMLTWCSRHRCWSLPRRAACLQVLAIVVIACRRPADVRQRQIYVSLWRMSLSLASTWLYPAVWLAAAAVELAGAGVPGLRRVTVTLFWVRCRRRWRSLDLVHATLTVQFRHKRAAVVHLLTVVAVDARRRQVRRKFRFFRQRRKFVGLDQRISEDVVVWDGVSGLRRHVWRLQTAGRLCRHPRQQTGLAIVSWHEGLRMMSTEERRRWTGGRHIRPCGGGGTAAFGPGRGRRHGCRRVHRRRLVIVTLHQRVHEVRTHLAVTASYTKRRTYILRELSAELDDDAGNNGYTALWQRRQVMSVGESRWRRCTERIGGEWAELHRRHCACRLTQSVVSWSTFARDLTVLSTVTIRHILRLKTNYVQLQRTGRASLCGFLPRDAL